MTPRCSVVVPTHDRSTSLARLLAGLERQTLPVGEFEVVVVLDGCTDASRRVAGAWSGRLRLTAVEQPREGPARARNAGAAVASGEVLVLLDDDLEPAPTLLEAHLAAHDRHADGALTLVLGDYPMWRTPGDSLYQLVTWQWWEALFQRRRRPDHVPTYLDCVSGNLSMRTASFLEIGGFDARFLEVGGEDYELGWRLLRAGARFVVAPDATAWHHHRGDVRGAVARQRAEGRTDVLLGTIHPALRGTLRLAQSPNRDVAPLVAWSFRAPELVDRLVLTQLEGLSALERVGARRRWTNIFNRLRAYAYWQGVRDRLPTPAAVAAFLEGVGDGVVPLVLDDGLPDDLPATLDALGRHHVRVMLGTRPIGDLVVETPLAGDLRSHLAAEVTHHLGPRLRAAAGSGRRG